MWVCLRCGERLALSFVGTPHFKGKTEPGRPGCSARQHRGSCEQKSYLPNTGGPKAGGAMGSALKKQLARIPPLDERESPLEKALLAQFSAWRKMIATPSAFLSTTFVLSNQTGRCHFSPKCLTSIRQFLLTS